MIVLEDLAVSAGDFRLDRISLAAGPGEYLVLLGPSGAGKTILLEVIAGIRAPESGTVVINDRDMTGILPEERGTALVYQDYSLFPHMTVAENIAYGLKVKKRPAHEITERTNSLLADFGIAALTNRYPGSLSGGEQQRVAIARALATKPSVLLLDEPFASLDPRTRDDCIRVMQELKERRSITIVQVSHSRDEAYALADRVVVLLEGRIAQAGNPDEIFRSPISTGVAQFIGMENVLAGTIINNGPGRSLLAVGDGTIPLSAEYPSGARITIGIPADSVRIFSVEPASGEPGMVILPCHITRVTSGKDAISFRLVGAIPLTSVMRRTCDRMEVPRQGTEVFAVFTNTDIRILSGD